MILLPAIDIKGGECVRLVKGDYATAHKVAADALRKRPRIAFVPPGPNGSIWSI
jgi:phosphoribosylformimino-5-aminoimidazole carboxamide ribonucleotide (ProFAR) isomerase